MGFRSFGRLDGRYDLVDAMNYQELYAHFLGLLLNAGLSQEEASRIVSEEIERRKAVAILLA